MLIKSKNISFNISFILKEENKSLKMFSSNEIVEHI